MDVERIRLFLLSLPQVKETMQWGENVVFWAGDKAAGGRTFAVMNLDAPTADEESGRKPRLLLSYAAGPERFAELLEREGFVPAPYMARAHWVAVEHWEVFTPAEWRDELRSAYERTVGKLTAKTRKALLLP